MNQQENMIMFVTIAGEMLMSSAKDFFPEEYFVAVGEIDTTKPFEFYAGGFGACPNDPKGLQKTCFPCWVRALDRQFTRDNGEKLLEGMFDANDREQCVHVKLVASNPSTGVTYLVTVLTNGKWRVFDVTLIGHNAIDDSGFGMIEGLLSIFFYKKFFEDAKRE